MDRDQTRRAFERETLPALRRALTSLLPGERAHQAVLPRGGSRALPPGTKTKSAAVLLALYACGTGNEVGFPLIRRPDSMLRHAGQISLPGGVHDGSEDPEACALREGHEEIGLAPETVEILGRLTPIIIPITRFRVETVLGWVASLPPLRPQEGEVIRIVHADPDRLAREGPKETLVRERDGRRLEFPAYNVDGEIVWGATALILAEFLEIWRKIRPLGS